MRKRLLNIILIALFCLVAGLAFTGATTYRAPQAVEEFDEDRWQKTVREQDVKDLYEYEAGLSLEDPPPLTTYKPDDEQEFMTEP